MPALVVDGVATTIQNPSQIATALGLEVPDRLPVAVLARETLTILNAWLGAIGGIDLETLTAPTPSRGRSLRNLTVNVFHAIDLLPEAWRTGSFAWEPELDDQREAVLTTAPQITAYVDAIRHRWRDFVESELLPSGEGSPAGDTRDAPLITSPRGEVSFPELLDAQRTHAAYHYRQLEHVLNADDAGRTVAEPVLTRLTGLDLPGSVY